MTGVLRCPCKKGFENNIEKTCDVKKLSLVARSKASKWLLGVADDESTRFRLRLQHRGGSSAKTNQGAGSELLLWGWWESYKEVWGLVKPCLVWLGVSQNEMY